MRCSDVNFPFLAFRAEALFTGAGAYSSDRAGRALGGDAAMIVMNQLIAGYDRQPVTRAISGVIERGSMTAIIGANGCGKSTLLKTLAGFIPPVSGNFRWQGKRPTLGWLASMARSTIDELSGGQFQRMLFARVLVQQAPLVMLDEPFTGVDESTSNVLMELMLEMYLQGQTVLAVLHDSERVARHFPQTLRLDADVVHWKTDRVRVA